MGAVFESLSLNSLYYIKVVVVSLKKKHLTKMLLNVAEMFLNPSPILERNRRLVKEIDAQLSIFFLYIIYYNCDTFASFLIIIGTF